MVQTPGRSPSLPAPRTALRVRDDMTVEVALAVMTGARVEYLLLCDGDDECTGSVTRSELALHRDGPRYTDRVRLRDILVPGQSSPSWAEPLSFRL
ncbi:hypothetical protein HEK131_60120 [Streptomyces seoulensis]|nr:CBS domain-containing protein [Streptomyces sp. BV129]BDH08785.1 hypothetical protein HEK131_60120 [Streptomyces seoulensis]